MAKPSRRLVLSPRRRVFSIDKIYPPEPSGRCPCGRACPRRRGTPPKNGGAGVEGVSLIYSVQSTSLEARLYWNKIIELLCIGHLDQVIYAKNLFIKNQQCTGFQPPQV